MQENTPPAAAINETWSAYPRDKCIDTIFSAHAARNPNAIALAYKGEEISYGQLEERSNRLANYLIGRGCRREAVVGVCIDRSPEVMVAVLAVLKAGGAYLPLDMDYPVERLLYMVDHVSCGLILGNAGQLSAFQRSDRKLLDLDHHRSGVDEAPIDAPALERRSSDLAYVMFTSGTTGNPKGVGVEHYNVARLVLNTNYVHISQKDVFFQLSSMAFDASTFEIWGALLNGAKLVLYDRPSMDVQRVEALIDQHGVSVLWLSAGLFNQIVETSMSMFGPVRQLLVGGDVLSASHVRKVMDANPGCQVINGYGPTECTTFSVCFRVTRQSLNGSSLPIGKPVANSRVHVLDEDLLPVAPGKPGELYIGGEGVSRGYIGSPDLTAEKFMTVPHGVDAGRVYRTGDLVRLGEDGNLYFLGRADRQLKVRGYRVEPGEIEAAILTCCEPGITQAVVVGIGDKRGDKRLVAYVVGLSGKIPGSVELRNALRKILPSYMVPANFVYLDRIPLTNNGKVDRDRLPDPEWKPLASSSADKPRTPFEKEISAIWVEVLAPNESIGMGETIADVGGTGIHIEKIVKEIAFKYGVYLKHSDFDPSTTKISEFVNSLKEQLSKAQTKEDAYERVYE